MNEKVPDMDEMIKRCEEIREPGQVIVFGLGAGRIMPKFGMVKAQKKAMKFIGKQKGFIGVHPIDLWHTLLLYETLNDAKGAKNELKFRNCPVGEVVPVLIQEEYLQKAKDKVKEINHE